MPLTGLSRSPERWIHPCRGSRETSENLLPELVPELINIRREDEQQLSYLIWHKAHDVLEAAMLLRDRYVSTFSLVIGR